jgi:glycerol kinase
VSRLALEVTADAVTATVVDDHGVVTAHARAPLTPLSPGPGLEEHAPDEIWQSALAAARLCLDDSGGGRAGLVAVTIVNGPGTALLWDRETLGSPRRAIGPEDRRARSVCDRLREAGHEGRVIELSGRSLDHRSLGARLGWLAEHEPNTWALVEQGRYAVGGVESYLVARLSRGLWHLTDADNAARTQLSEVATGRWSAELCGIYGVPLDALPEVAPSGGSLASTDPRSFLGLELRVATRLH